MTEQKLKEKYGLITAIAMVIGIVVGSGVFFKAEKVLTATGGDMKIGILAWVLGGLNMVICAYTFAVMASEYVYVNGLVDYAEATVGKKYAYAIGWFAAIIYYPTLTSVLAWVSARYICVLLGWSIVGSEAMILAGFLLVTSFAVNTLSPVLAGKFQVTTTVIKLIPLLLMGIVGVIVGLSNGMTVSNFSGAVYEVNKGSALFIGVCATAFAYEGWIIATSINSEIKNAKKNLPRALVFGTLVIMLIYIVYYVGLTGAVENAQLMENGEAGVMVAFTNMFTQVGGVLLMVFVIISCLGTLNGLMLGCCRGFYSLAARDLGPKPHCLKSVDPKTNMPANAAICGVLLCAFWLLYFYGANLAETPWFGPFSFDSSELPIITLYLLYIPIFIMFMRKCKNLSAFKRFVMPTLAICSSLFMVTACCISHGMTNVYYLIVFAVVTIIGFIVYSKNAGKEQN